MNTVLQIRSLLLVCFIATVSSSAMADEGMWLFNNLPKKHLKEKHGFEPTDQWARHVMLSSVRFNSGGSASFVSSQGLVLTNHHVGADTLHKISTKENNYYTDGFYAESFGDEIKTPDLELNQLVSIEDVTQRVNGSVKQGMSPAESFAARRAVRSEIEKESLEKTKLRSDVVTLYGGARYHLYRYKKYTDVRLVWSPESAIAFFGGDADNFEYPRFCLDVCLFRVYENDKPAEIEHFLKMSSSGAADGEVVFVSGNPGRTQRIYTTAALKYQRDKYLPYALNFLRRREILFQQFGFEGEEQKRRARDELFGLQNSRKALTGMLQGLQDPAVMKGKQKKEEELRAQVGANEKLRSYSDAWNAIEEVQTRKAALLGKGTSLAGRHYQIANTLVFMASEDEKENSKRLREYRQSARESLRQKLFSAAPIHNDVQRVKLADSIALMVERRGGDDPIVQLVLAGQSPRDRASQLIDGTGLSDVDARKELAEGGLKAIKESKDPMIVLARSLESEARRSRKISEELSELERQAYTKIADATFLIQGTTTYPDATFTLRLAFGPVRGYEESGAKVAPWTTMGGAFDHEKKHAGQEGWELPARWKERRGKIDESTPLNFVCTADIIGGNSGSPVINKKAELVGVIFDGNIQSLTSDYTYTKKVARAVSVHSSALLEALDKIYDARRLVNELGK